MLLFANTIAGLTSFRSVRRGGKHLYILGERHEDVPNEASVALHTAHAAREVLRVARSSPHEQVFVYMEADCDYFEGANRARINAAVDENEKKKWESHISPIVKMNAAHYTNALPQNVRTFFCNIRQTLPFALFYLVLNPNAFKVLFASRLNNLVPNLDASVKRWAKKFETGFTNQVVDSHTSFDFMEAIVSPDIPTPIWMTELEIEIFKGVSPNRMKLELADLKSTQRSVYERIMNTFRQFARRPTPVFWRTGDKEFIQTYFFNLVVFLQDVYMCNVYARMRNHAPHHIFMVGELHVLFLSVFLTPSATEVHAWEHSGDCIVNRTHPEVPVIGSLLTYKTTLEAYLQQPSPSP